VTDKTNQIATFSERHVKRDTKDPTVASCSLCNPKLQPVLHPFQNVPEFMGQFHFETYWNSNQNNETGGDDVGTRTKYVLMNNARVMY
jgi:uncharacterized protein with PIN domain